MEVENYIKLENCIDGNLYKINARNASFGFFIKERNYFMISRYKFGSRFIDFELHFDYNYGTCQPLEDLGKIEIDLKDENKCLEYLNSLISN